MKTLITQIVMAFATLVAITACSESNVSDLQLGGDCNVQAIALDKYEGTTHLPTRSITVRVPQSYDVSNMELTTLQLSAGATANIKQGDHLDFTTPRTMRVRNADVYEDWTISVRRDEAKITSFKINDLYTGIIDEGARTISVYVPEALNLSSLVPTFTLSDNATASIVSGVAISFAKPVQITVTNNTATTTYTVTVTKIGKPEVVFVGLAQSMDQLNIEELTACRWMLANVPNSLYVSFADIKNKNIDLSA